MGGGAETTSLDARRSSRVHGRLPGSKSLHGSDICFAKLVDHKRGKGSWPQQPSFGAKEVDQHRSVKRARV